MRLDHLLSMEKSGLGSPGLTDQWSIPFWKVCALFRFQGASPSGWVAGDAPDPGPVARFFGPIAQFG